MNLRKILVAFFAVVIALLGAGTASAHSGVNLPLTTANIGDSFASGLGGIETGPYLPGSDTPTDHCRRSQTSPARLLPGLANVLIDAACSGATTDNMLSTGQFGEPSQISQLRPGTQLVYITIGGNDVGFGQVAGCFIQLDCDKTSLPAQTLYLISQLGPHLDAVYNAVQAQAPHAIVVVNLYLPVAPHSVKAAGPNCPELNTKEIPLANKIQTALNNMIAMHARAHGFVVADPTPYAEGGDVCSANPLFYGPVTRPDAPYHPNLPGRKIIAAASAIALIKRLIQTH